MKKTLLAVVLLAASGCSVQTEAQMHPGTPAFLPADELKVTKTPTPTTDEIFYLIDSSGSNRFREPVGKEIIGHVATTPDTARLCVIQIASDSQASDTRSWCREPVVSYTCEHPPVKSGEFTNTRERTAYQAAASRLEAEKKACEEERERDRLVKKMGSESELTSFLAGLSTTSHTDIEGAFKLVENTSTAPDAAHTVWVWSDMVEDLKVPRKAPLAISLTGWTTNVRLIRNVGANSADLQEEPWRARLAGWGITQVEWKSFRIGEFGAPALDDVTPPVAQAKAKAPRPQPAVTAEPGDPSGAIIEDDGPIVIKRGDPSSFQAGEKRRR